MLRIIYFGLKYYYIKGKIKKDNIFIKLFVNRWNSSERVKRSKKDLLLNDKYKAKNNNIENNKLNGNKAIINNNER